jgi:outer membrane protein assembly factor BamE (lipoprotein component of BamABCDE complex)
MSVVPCTSRILLLLSFLALLSCSNQHVQEFHQVHQGMSRSEVRELLGTPSSTFAANQEGGIPLPERWQYGDSLSTMATSAMFPDHAPGGVWVVYFDGNGRVSNIRKPQDDQQPWRPDVK